MTTLQKPESALIIVGHGSTQNPDSSAPTYAHQAAIRRRGIFAEVQCAFWKEEPSLREVLRMVEADDVYVVPNFISEGYFTEKVIPRELELNGPITRRGNRTIKYCEPVGNDPRMVELLLRRAREVAPEVPRHHTSLVIVAHGTGLNENSAVAAKKQVAQLQQRRLYAQVLAAYMEEEPMVARWRQLTREPYVVVVPFFISDGLHSYQDIPVLLGIEPEPTAAASQQEVFRRNPYRLGDRTLYYASAIGTEPAFADIILDTVARFDAASVAAVAGRR
ncbi:MAG: cobalamin biosynthesis protein CbiX [Verrucomicrobia bacterium]|nr:cobalamin biosynthesis protein CbiX [Verrucomicrobiota bacterium]